MRTPGHHFHCEPVLEGHVLSICSLHFESNHPTHHVEYGIRRRNGVMTFVEIVDGTSGDGATYRKHNHQVHPLENDGPP